MAVGKSSLKRVQSAAESEKKETVQTAAPEGGKKAAPEKAAAKKAAVKLTVSQEEGVNAHYGINTPLPVFLL